MLMTSHGYLSFWEIEFFFCFVFTSAILSSVSSLVQFLKLLKNGYNYKQKGEKIIKVFLDHLEIVYVSGLGLRHEIKSK